MKKIVCKKIRKKKQRNWIANVGHVNKDTNNDFSGKTLHIHQFQNISKHHISLIQKYLQVSTKSAHTSTNQNAETPQSISMLWMVMSSGPMVRINAYLVRASQYEDQILWYKRGRPL